MQRMYLFVLIFIGFNSITSGQQVESIRFACKPEKDHLNQPLSISLQGIDLDDNYIPVLYRLDSGEKVKVSCQLEKGYSPLLWFVPGKDIAKDEEYIFELDWDNQKVEDNIMSSRTDAKNITLLSGDSQILSYRHALIEAPKGINPLFQREGGYIHPLVSPGGSILTRIQPPDHYHHYGIWNPWTRTIFEGRKIDFWNLADGQGTVKYTGTISTFSGQLFSGFKVLHEHVDFTAPGEDKTALNEVWDVRAWSLTISGKPVWIIDFAFTLNCATDSVVILEQYRYGGGLGYRTTEDWNRYNSTVLTSEGKTRKDADGSKAKWCRIEGEMASGTTSGVLVMSHPSNRAHPEPMRVWPEDQYTRGDLFFEFCPIRHDEWILYPGIEYVLKYRMVVFDGEVDPGVCEVLWDNYAHPPVVRRME